MRLRPVCLAACLMLALVGPASLTAAGERDVITRRGSCSGRGEWTLRVRHETATTIRVRFIIDRLDPGETWQVFLSDNGTRIFSASRVVDADGEVRAVKVTSDRAGTDRIKGSAVNVGNGGSCEGVLRYRA
jgi:hypothetical protein